MITLGIINGGLGLRLSGNTVKGEIAYGVIACIMWWLWMVVVIWSYYRKYANKDRVGKAGEKAVGGLEGSPHSDGGMYWRDDGNGSSRTNGYRI